MHAVTRFGAYDFNAERVAKNLRAVIETGQNGKGTHCFFVAEDGRGQIAGALIGCVERHFSPIWWWPASFTTTSCRKSAWAVPGFGCSPPFAGGRRTGACSNYPLGLIAAPTLNVWTNFSSVSVFALRAVIIPLCGECPLSKILPFPIDRISP